MTLSPSPSPSPARSPLSLGRPGLSSHILSKSKKALLGVTREKPLRNLHYHAPTLNALEGHLLPAQEQPPVSQFDLDSTDEDERVKQHDGENDEGENEDSEPGYTTKDRASSVPPIATLRLGRLRRDNLHVLDQCVGSSVASKHTSARESMRTSMRDLSQSSRSRTVSMTTSRSRKPMPSSPMFTFGRQNEALMIAEDLGYGLTDAAEPQDGFCFDAPDSQPYTANGMLDGSSPRRMSHDKNTAASLKSAASATEQNRGRRTKRDNDTRSALTVSASQRQQRQRTERSQQPPPSVTLDLLDEFSAPPKQAPPSPNRGVSHSSSVSGTKRLSMPLTAVGQGSERGSMLSRTSATKPEEKIIDPISEAAEQDLERPSNTLTRTGTGQRGAEMEARAEEAVAARKRFGSVDHTGWDAALATLSLSSSPSQEFDAGLGLKPGTDVAVSQAQQGSLQSQNIIDRNEDREETRDRQDAPVTPPPPQPRIRRRGRRDTPLTMSFGDSDSESGLDDHVPCRGPAWLDLDIQSAPQLLDSTIGRDGNGGSSDDDDQNHFRPLRVADFASTDAAAKALMQQQQQQRQAGTSEPLTPFHASPVSPQHSVNRIMTMSELSQTDQGYPALEAQITPPPPPPPPPASAPHSPVLQRFQPFASAATPSLIPHSSSAQLNSDQQHPDGSGPDIQAWRHSLVPSIALTTSASVAVSATPNASSSTFSRAATRIGTEPRINVRSAPFSSSESASYNSDDGSGGRRRRRRRDGTEKCKSIGGAPPGRLKRMTMKILGRDWGDSYGDSSDSIKDNGYENAINTISISHNDNHGGTAIDARNNRTHSTATTATTNTAPPGVGAGAGAGPGPGLGLGRIKFQDSAAQPYDALHGDRHQQPRSRRPSGYPDLSSTSSFAGGVDKAAAPAPVAAAQKKTLGDMGSAGGPGGVSRMKRLGARMSRMFHS
ncbi:hypothetical protein BD289DRAFT_503469 [Coniella lustricola]|uniref:Uncharacterized protein n=1 Tax=Coniella lustricola TaxID=2025994 RepID=A0A2T3AHR8_9PEZI|nr:hypothetical protein BD289DRAFT_503469 [Coniella lustricola]